MAKDIMERLKNDILVGYAPMQTLLMDWGKDLESHLSEWVLANPEKYQDALRKSYAAGCDMGMTATQASTIFRASSFGLQDRVYEFNYKSAKLAKEVTPNDRFVVGNLSASNPDFLEPVGNMTYEYVYEGYKEQVLGLAEGGVDVFLIPGNHIDELLIAVKVAKELTDIPVIACNVFYKGKVKKGFRGMMSQEPITASTRADEAGADVVGTLCGEISYEDMPEVISLMREGTDKLLCAMPDAGIPQLIDGETVSPITREQVLQEVPKWIDAGARIVGGCCSTTLEHYQAFSEAVRQWKSKGH
jgi:5-methyltetrahydrofolate--homocysteine methyltransferase